MNRIAWLVTLLGMVVFAAGCPQGPGKPSVDTGGSEAPAATAAGQPLPGPAKQPVTEPAKPLPEPTPAEPKQAEPTPAAPPAAKEPLVENLVAGPPVDEKKGTFEEPSENPFTGPIGAEPPSVEYPLIEPEMKGPAVFAEEPAAEAPTKEAGPAEQKPSAQ